MNVPCVMRDCICGLRRGGCNTPLQKSPSECGRTGPSNEVHRAHDRLGCFSNLLTRDSDVKETYVAHQISNQSHSQSPSATSAPWLGIRRGGASRGEGAPGSNFFFIEKRADGTPFKTGDHVRVRSTEGNPWPRPPQSHSGDFPADPGPLVIIKVPGGNSPGPEIRLNDCVKICRPQADLWINAPNGTTWPRLDALDSVFVMQSVRG